LRCIFFCTELSTSAINILSLHDALPICLVNPPDEIGEALAAVPGRMLLDAADLKAEDLRDPGADKIADHHKAGVVNAIGDIAQRSEEHTSELQSRFDLVCRLLLEKKNKR